MYQLNVVLIGCGADVVGHVRGELINNAATVESEFRDVAAALGSLRSANTKKRLLILHLKPFDGVDEIGRLCDPFPKLSAQRRRRASLLEGAEATRFQCSRYRAFGHGVASDRSRACRMWGRRLSRQEGPFARRLSPECTRRPVSLGRLAAAGWPQENGSDSDVSLVASVSRIIEFLSLTLSIRLRIRSRPVGSASRHRSFVQELMCFVILALHQPDHLVSERRA